MSHEIEADYVLKYSNEDQQCPHCKCFEAQDDGGFCNELNQKVPLTAHCDFFSSID